MTYVLIHGGTFAGDCWAPLLPHLDGAAIAPDLPGRRDNVADHGKVTLDDCVRSVLRDMDLAGIDRADLVGHSLGGATTAAIAAHAPDRVASLSFLAAPVPTDGGTVLSAVGEDVRGFLTGIMAAGAVSIPSPAETGSFGDIGARLGVAEPARLFAEPVPLSGLAAVPVLSYVLLENDQALPPDRQMASIDNIVRHAPCTIIRVAVGHMAMIDDPATLALALARARRGLP